MLILAIETSCDEAGVALLVRAATDARPKLLAQAIASQEEVHSPYGGIVPELASRRHLETLSPLVRRTLEQTGLKIREIEGVAVTYAPGLVGSLLVGVSFAKALAYALRVPCIGVHHIEGHLHAPFLENDELRYPFIGLVVSGGHTSLYDVKGLGSYELLGGTRDDAAGEAFDKVARILGLGYPGGPFVDRLSISGNKQAFRFPRARVGRYEFSFSGLKSAVKHEVASGPIADGRLADLCASFQEAVVTELVEKTVAAAGSERSSRIVVSGGVACNHRLRELFAERCRAEGIALFIPSPPLCTDNAAMIGYVGLQRLMRGERGALDMNAVATLELTRAG